MNCKPAFLFLFFQLLWAQQVRAEIQQVADVVSGSVQEVAMIVEKAFSYVRHPELLNVDRIKKDFPGRYNRSGCEDRFKFCSYVNADESEQARLSSFEVPYHPSLVPNGGVLTVTLPESQGCYRLSNLNALFGVAGERLAVPSGDMFFGSDESGTEVLQYKNISQQQPQFSVTAFVHGECVVTLNFDMKSHR